jgi:hypothetical protein
MRIPLRSLVSTALASAAIFALATLAWAETCSLELKRLDSSSSANSDEAYHAANAQSIFVQLGKDDEPLADQGPVAAFKRIVKKEPKYLSAHPFRAVLKLGSKEYAFALDVVPPPAKDAKSDDKKAKSDDKKTKEKGKTKAAKAASASTTFNRLYFDLNHNGDLSDDKPVDAEMVQGARRWGGFFQFPRVDVVLDEAGTKLDYSFFLAGQQIGGSRDFHYVMLSMNPGVYREGHITLEGKKRHVVLIDYNSNGRFNDEMGVPKDVSVSSGPVPVEQGDMLLIDPKAGVSNDANDSMHYVSKLANIDGRFYEVKISPSGDQLTLTASALPLGYVKNPNAKYRATIYGDQGFVDIRSEKGEPVAVPEGQWKLLSYNLDATVVKEPKKGEKKADEKNSAEKEEKKDEKGAEKGSMLKSLAEGLNSLLGGSSEGDSGVPQSTVSAQATGSYKAVKVVKGETVALPFGPPYKPVVTADAFEDGEKHEVLSLRLTLVGSAGETCDDMTVKGGRPSKPKFTITDAKGKVVEEGRFEYG